MSESLNGVVQPRSASRSEKKRTPQMLAAICELVKNGLSVSHAAEKLHTHHTTVSRWRKELPDFDAAISAAEAEFIDSQIANIREAAKKSWQASAWLLERKWPTFFSQPQVQLNMPNAKINLFDDFGAMLAKFRNSPEAMRKFKEINGYELPAIEVESDSLQSGPSVSSSEEPVEGCVIESEAPPDAER